MRERDVDGYILGVDVGTNSIGWAVLDAADGKPVGVRCAGVRIFDQAVEGDIESGRDEPKSAKRRQARAQRRSLWRRARRLRSVFILLQRGGLLPAGPATEPEERHRILQTLDGALLARHVPIASIPGGAAAAHVLPYTLRARALDQRLEPHEFGRALYHLAQRRGFRSNRKSDSRDADERGKVKQGIGELAELMAKAQARTLGEYFSKLDPRERRIRTRHTDRKMYETEFDLIWAAQAPHHPAVATEDLRKQLRRAVFFQRALRWDRSTIGVCDLETRRRRAPWAFAEVQRFRLLQRVNDLKVQAPGQTMSQPLTMEQRAAVIEALETGGDLKFHGKGRARTVWGVLDLTNDHTFNLEAGGEETLRGNRTEACLRRIFGERWPALSASEREGVVLDLMGIEDPRALARRARKVWRLDDAAAGEFAETTLEEGYCSLSRQAIRTLLPLMEQGLPYAEARKSAYPDRDAQKPAETLLSQPPRLRNPIVERALAEMRRTVNALLRKYGRPDFIHVELARDLKRGRKRREELAQRARANERARDAARARILKEAGKADPRPGDIVKVRLAEECDWTCPYTGRRFGMSDLVSDSPQIDVEHIIPYSASLDDSFANKTLCFAEENRNAKGNRTPFEAYGQTPRWREILQRVRRFKSSADRRTLM